MAITGDQRLLKRINRMALVRLVRSRPGLSRAELAQSTGLTKSTVSLLAQELIDEGWLREDPVLVTGAIGRRPTPLRLDGRHLVVIGAELGVGCVRVVTMSLDGEVLESTEAGFALATDVEAVVKQLAEQIAHHVALQAAAGRELLGVGVGVPGAVQADSGVLVVAPNLGWRNVPLKAMLAEELKQRKADITALFVKNDCDVAALGEVEFSNSEIGDPLLFVGLGVGVGSGLVIGGRLLVGGRGFAGEVGHTQLYAQGPRCSCGRTGCAEAYFGLRAMAEAQHCSIEQLEQRAAAGEPKTQTALAEAGQYLGVTLHNLWMTLDPAVIVLGGAACRLGDAFLQPALRTFASLAQAAGLDTPPVTQARFGELCVAAGAGALVLHDLLMPI